MFKKILALDVHDKIPKFTERVKKYSLLEPLIVDNIINIDAEKVLDIDTIWISFKAALDKKTLGKMKNLKNVFVYGSSINKIDINFCLLNNIKVHAVNNYCDNETAEWVIGQIIHFFRKKSLSINGKTLGVIGVGAVGKLVLKIALALNMKIYFYALTEHSDLLGLNVKKQSLKEIFIACDVVSVHVPAFEKCLFANELFMAKKGLLLINTCLGQVIDEHDLYKFLSSRRDVSIIMDKVSSEYYSHPSILSVDEKAYFTEESAKKLDSEFFRQIENTWA